MQRTLSYAAQRATATLAAIAMSLAFAILPAAAATDDPWISIRKEFYGDRQIVDTKAPLIVEAPDKAEDAALVPVSIYLMADIADNTGRFARKLTSNAPAWVAPSAPTSPARRLGMAVARCHGLC